MKTDTLLHEEIRYIVNDIHKNEEEKTDEIHKIIQREYKVSYFNTIVLFLLIAVIFIGYYSLK